MNAAQELFKLKELINDKIREKAELEGQLKELLRHLQELGYSSVEEAQEALEKLNKRKTTLEQKYETQFAELKRAIEAANFDDIPF